MLIMTIVFAASCEFEMSTPTYKLNTSECGFVTVAGEKIVELGTEIDLTKIKIEREPLAGNSDIVTIPVTEDMISGDYSTDTVGEKKIIITAVGETFEIAFEVKYGVKFVAGDEVVSQQYLAEGEKPEIPDVAYLAPAGTHFAGWDPEIPASITQNTVFTAQYAKDITPPSLKTLNATYGQTLSELTLPKNAQGEWRFVDDGDTAVGNVGNNEFDVEFVPKEAGADTISGTVTVKVAKAKIQFEDLVVEFTYDGTAKYPTYTVPDGVAVMEMGDRGVDAGTYEFTLRVSSNNYDGYYFGQYVITKAKTTVTLPDYELTFDQVKTFKPSEYSVTEGFDKALLGDVTLVKPNVSGAGEYQITVEYTNVSNVTATVTGGKITVTQSTFNPDDLVIDEVIATYGDRLGDIALSEHGSGTWSWKYPELYINSAGKYTATVVFTPNNAGYQPVEKVIDIKVNKKELTISVTPETLIYNGSEQAISATSYIIGDGSYENIAVKIVYTLGGAQATPKNAGSYGVTIEIVDDRYYGTASTDLTIDKATPTVDFKETFEISWSPDGRVLANINLSGIVPTSDLGVSGKYSWKNGQTSIAADENIGKYVAYAVIFTPDDTDNYNVTEGELNVRVNKANGTIKTADNKTTYEFAYNGNAQDIAALIERGHTESELVYDLDLSTIKNVGRYVFTVTLPESAHYSETTKEITVIIKHGEFPYNQSNAPAGLKATYGDTLASVILPADAQGAWRWKDESAYVGNAGKPNHIAIFTPADEGYSAIEVVVTIEVAKKELTLTAGNSVFTYDGDAKSVDIAIDGYVDASHVATLTGNLAEINAGSYTFTVTVADNNYSGSVEVMLVINKADYVPTVPENLSATYGDTLSSLELPSDANGVWAWVLADTTSVGDAGSRAFKAIFTHNNHNYNAYEHEFTVIVAKQKVTAPADETTEYNGASQTSSYEDTNVYTVQNVRETNVGKYTVTFTLKDADNYEWDGDNTATFTITRAENVWITEPKLNKTVWTFGEAAAVLEAGEAKFGNIIVSVIPEKVGSYYVTVSVIGNANYTGIEAIAFNVTINKAKVALPGNTSVVYTGAEQTSAYTDTALYTVTNVSGTDVGDYTVTFALRDSANYEWADGNTSTFSITKATNKWTTAPALDKRVWTYGDASAIINSYAAAFGTADVTLDGVALEGALPALIEVGDHTLVFTVSDTDNYAGLTATVNFTVNKAANAWTTEPTIDKVEWIFGEAGAVVNKGAATFGEIVVSAIPTTAGDHIITVTVADTKNYAGLEFSFEVTIKKAKVTLTETDSSVVYNGSEQTSEYEDTALYTVTNVSGTDVGEYTVTFALIDTDNYEWDGKNTVTYTITKAGNEWTTEPTIDKFEWIFGEAGATVNVGAATFGDIAVSAIPTTAGDHIITVTVADTKNYAGLEFSFEVTIKKAKVTLTETDSTVVYNGAEQTSEYENTELYTVTNVTATDVGDYTVTFALIDTDNYEWDGKNTVTYTITKAGNEWTTEPTIDKVEWIYGEAGAVVNKGAATFGEIAVSAIPTTAGDHVITVTVADTANYAGLEFSFEVTIAKAKVALPADRSVVYNGTEQTSAYEDTALYTVTNAIGTDVGSYTVTFALTDADNYEWADGNTVTYTITKAGNAWITEPTIDKVEWIYGEAGAVVNKGAATFGEIAVSAIPTTAGDHVITVTVADTKNYAGLEFSFEVTIKKAKVALPDAASTEYTGGEQTSAYEDTDVYTVTNVSGTTVGEYIATFALIDTDNYEWADGNTQTFTIVKAQNAWITVPAVPNIVYGETISPVAVSKFGTVKVEFKLSAADDSEYSEDAPSEYGAYVARFSVEGTDNYYDITRTVNFSISGTINSWITEPTIDKLEWTYGEAGAVLNAGAAEYGDVTVTIDGAPYTAMPTEAGTYEIAIEVIGNNNYAGLEEITFTIVIKKAKVALTETDSSVVYNGSEQTSEYEDADLYTVTNVTATDVGEYTVTFALIDTDNYEWDGKNTVIYTITKAGNAWTTEPTIDKVEWIYGEAGAVVNKGAATFGEIAVSAIPTVAGTHTVTVTVADTANYAGLEVTFEVTIAKAKVTLTETDSSVVYNGSEQTSEYENTELYTVTNVTATDVGEYTVTFALIDTDNYEWDGKNTVTYTVTKAGNEWTAEPTIDKVEWIFGEAGATVNVGAATFGEIAVSAIPTVAGTHTVTVTVADTANYAGLEVTFEVTVAKAKVTLDAVDSSVVYSGAEQTSEYENTELYTVTNVTATDVGDYTVTFALIDTDNYEWDGKNTVTYTITKAGNEWTTEPTIDKVEWIYGEAGAVVNKGAATFGEIAVSAIPTTAGDHVITVTVADTANYAGLEFSFEVTIKKAKVALPADSSVVYNGAEQTSAYEDTALYTVTNVSGTDVGSYTVTFALIDTDNYEWADGNTVTFAITKAANKWTTAPALDKTIWTYGDASATIKAYASTFGTASVTLDGEALEGAIPATIDAGAHTLVFTIADTDNYAGLTATVNFTVNKAGNAWTTEPTIDKLEWTYGEAGAVVNKGAATFGEIAVSAIPTTVGEHTITVTVADTKNYAGLEMTFEVVIKKAKVTLTETDSSVVYNGSEQTSEYADTELYTVTNVSATVVGSYTVTFALIDTDNYEWDGKNTVTFSITKAKVTAPDVMTTVPYDGDQHSAVVDSTLYAVDSYDSDDRAAVGEYVVTLKLTDTTNYEWDGANTTKLVITKSTPTIGELKINGWVYGAYNAGNNAPSAKVTNIKGVAVTFSYWDGDVEITDLAALVPGTYTLRATVAGCDDYDGASAETTFKVDKISVTVPSVTGSYTYNGNPITAEIASGEYYDITTNTGYITAGEHYVVLTLKNSALYRWASDTAGTSATVSVPFTVAKAQSSVNVTVADWSFGSAASAPTVTGTLYDATYTVIYVGTTNAGVAYSSEDAPTEAGQYQIIVTVGETDNCLGSTKSASFEITKQKVDAPSGSFTAEYTGSAITPAVNSNVFNVGSATAVGNHNVSVTLRDTNNYEWSVDPNVAERYVSLEITKATTILSITVVNKAPYTGYAYGGLTVSCNIAGDNVVVLYYSNDGGVTWTTTTPKNVGLYYVYAEVVETDNYTYAKTDVEEFTIEAVSVDVTYYDYNAGEQYQNNVIQGGIAIGADGKVVNGKYEFTKTGKFTPSISSSAQGVYYKLSFTPYDNNYKPVNSVDVVVYLKPAAYIIKDGVKTYYGSIEDALEAAVSGDIVWAMIDTTGDNTIRNNCTVKSGVTLMIPYIDGVRNESDKAELTYSGAAYTVTNQVTILSGATLHVENGATLEIGGLRNAANADAITGNTCGKSAQLVLDSGAQITTEGFINCYGFIEESYADNGSSVIILNKGEISMPYVIYDFKGGSATATMVSKGKNKASIFNEFAFPNVVPTIEFRYGSRLYVVANIDADGDTHYSRGLLLSSDENALIQLTDESNSKFVSKYDKSTGVHNIQVIGGAKTNGFTINAAGTSANTKDYAFAIGYFFNITLKKAEGQESASYSMGQTFKILPGATLTVDEGVTLNINRVNMYEKGWNDPWEYRVLLGGETAYYYTYATVNPYTQEELDEGKIIVYGTLNATELGGNVYAMAGSSVNITTTSCTTGDLEYTVQGGLGGGVKDKKINANVISVGGAYITLNADGGNATDGKVLATDGTYPVLPTPTRYGYDFLGWYYGETLVTSGMALQANEAHTLVAKWSKKVVITLETMGAKDLDDVFSTDGKYPTLPTPTKAGFTFAGWYFAGTKVVAGEALKSDEDHILVAKWTADIKVSYVSDGVLLGTSAKITDGKYPTLPTPNKAGYDFVGWYYGDTKVEAGQALAVSGSHVLTAAWEESKLASYTVNFDANGGICTTTSTQANEGSTITLPTPDAREGYTFAGWFTAASGGELAGAAGAGYVLTADVTLYAQWTPISYKVTVSTSNATVDGVTNGQMVACGTTVSITVSFSQSNNKTLVVKDKNGKELLNKTAAGTYTFTMPAGEVTISASSEGSCVTPDTLVTLADGTQVRIDSLKGDELLLVWNMQTGKFDYAPIMFVDSDPEAAVEVINLYFSDGTVVKVISEHGFWDYDLNKYVYLDRYADEYIGHYFAKQNGDTLERVRLVDVVLTTEFTTAWSPVTVEHLCYIVNGMLSMPGGVGGLFNIFDVDPETMTYDEEAIMRDIETYGLFTYEELNAIAPLSREMFEAAGGAYMKISIGKGNLTLDELRAMIERYSKYV